MSEKRRDQRGRILKPGESQRNDGHYMFRYTDIHKKRRYVYAKTLEELRQKEADIQRDTVDGIDYAAGEMTVLELTSRFFWCVLSLPLFPVFNRSMVLCGFFNFQSGTA